MFGVIQKGKKGYMKMSETKYGLKEGLQGVAEAQEALAGSLPAVSGSAGKPSGLPKPHVKWTPENDRRLLVFGLERKVRRKEFKLIASTFPDPKPSLNAIERRMKKLRNETIETCGALGIFELYDAGQAYDDLEGYKLGLAKAVAADEEDEDEDAPIAKSGTTAFDFDDYHFGPPSDSVKASKASSGGRKSTEATHLKNSSLLPFAASVPEPTAELSMTRPVKPQGSADLVYKVPVAPATKRKAKPAVNATQRPPAEEHIKVEDIIGQDYRKNLFSPQNQALPSVSPAPVVYECLTGAQLMERRRAEREAKRRKVEHDGDDSVR